MRVRYDLSLSGLLMIFLFSNCLVGQQIQVQSQNYDGTVKTIGGDFLVLKTADGDITAQVNVAGAIDDGTSTMISVRGIAGAGFLRRGMMVDFRCRISKLGKIGEPVGEISVFTPLEFTRTGIKLLEEDSESPIESDPSPDAATEASQPNSNEDDLGQDADDENSIEKKSSRREIKTTPARVVGRISAVAKRKFTVEIVGNNRVSYTVVPVSDKTIVKYEVAEPALVQVGDSITVTASTLGNQRMMATSIVVRKETPQEIQQVLNEIALNPPKDKSVASDNTDLAGSDNPRQIKVSRLAAWSDWRPKRRKFAPGQNPTSTAPNSNKPEPDTTPDTTPEINDDEKSDGDFNPIR